MTVTTEPAQLLLLLNFLSPAFPTGAFAYSHGLERAIADGQAGDARSLQAWIAALLARGSGWNDAVIMAACWSSDLESVNELALSLCACRERHLETTALGASFAEAARVFLPLDLPAGDHAYPVVLAAAARAAGIGPEAMILAYLQSFSAALVSVAVRLVPLGQVAGLTVLRALMPDIAATARLAAGSSLDDLGAAAVCSDIAAMRHEFQQPRIFRT